jgi:hypothetical protein
MCEPRLQTILRCKVIGRDWSKSAVLPTHRFNFKELQDQRVSHRYDQALGSRHLEVSRLTSITEFNNYLSRPSHHVKAVWSSHAALTINSGWFVEKTPENSIILPCYCSPACLLGGIDGCLRPCNRRRVDPLALTAPYRRS